MINRHVLALFGIVLVLALAVAYLVPHSWTSDPEPWTPPATEKAPEPDPEPEPEQPATIREEVAVSRWMQSLMRDSGLLVDLPADRVAPNAGSSGCTLIGRLIWKDKPWAPLKGVTVALTDVWLDTILPSEQRVSWTPVLLPPDAKTNKQGRFVLHRVPTYRTLFLVIRDGKQTLHVQKLTYLPLPGRTLNLYEIGVPERGALSGVVVNEKGEPVHDIRVRAVHDAHSAGKFDDPRERGKRRVAQAVGFRAKGLSGTTKIPRWVLERDRLLPFPSTRTDRQGRFLLTGVRVGHTALFLQDRQHSDVVTDNVVTANETTDLGKLVVSAGYTLASRIVTEGPDKETHPLAGALVSVLPVSWPRGMPAVRTNARGEFKVPGLPDRNVRLYVRRPDSRIWERPGKAGPDYVLSQRTNYTVHVLDPSGKPVRNAELALSYHESRFTHRDVDCRMHVRRNPNVAGTFELRRIPSRVGLRLLATAPGFGPGVYTPIKVQPEIHIYLSRAQQLRIRVQGRHAKPLSGADVFVTFRTPPIWQRETQIPGRDYHLLTHKPMRLGRTDKDGWLVLENFWQSPMSFEARYRGYAMKKTAWMTPVPNQPITIRMLRAARLQGRLQLGDEPPKQPWVVLAMDGELVLDLYGRLIQEKLGTLHRTITAPDGSFFFNELHEDRWNLRVLRPSTARRMLTTMIYPRFRAWPDLEQDAVSVIAGETVFHEMKVQPDRTQSFQVQGTVSANGKPLPGIVVRAVPPSLSDRLRATSQRIAEVRRRWRQATLAARPKLRMELRRLSQTQRRLSRQRALRRPGSRVPASPGSGGLTETDNHGRFTLWLPHPGTYQVWAETLDRYGKQILAMKTLVIAEVDATPKPGAKTTNQKPTGKAVVQRGPIRLDLDVRSGSLIVTLTRHTGRRIGGRMFRIVQLDQNNTATGVVLRARANHEGEVHLQRVPAGRYRLQLEGHVVGNPVIERGLFQVNPGTLNVHHARSRPRDWGK